MLSCLKKICRFFMKNGLNISGLGDILLSGSRDSSRASYVSELISSVISAKDNENLPSLKKLFCSQKRNNPATDLSVFVSCWAFLCRFESRFLAGPSLSRAGNRPAFLRLDTASCAEMYPPRGRYALVRLSLTVFISALFTDSDHRLRNVAAPGQCPIYVMPNKLSIIVFN